MEKRCRAVCLKEFFANVYLPSAKVRKRSWRTDTSVFARHIEPFMGERPINAITFQEVSDWIEYKRKEGYAPATCNRFLAVLRSIFGLAQQRGAIMDRSPCAGVKAFQVPGGRERFLSRREARDLFLELECNPCREASAIILLILTGARKSEIIRARWRDVDFGRGLLTVPISKSGRPRKITLSSAAMKILREMKKTAASEWLFPAKNSQKPVSDIFYFWNKIRKKIGLSDVRIHDLRHTFASILVSMGQSLFIAQKLLGHQKPETTMRYAHLDTRPLRKAVELVSRFLNIERKEGD